jgi:cytochrome c oxidase subunit 2
MMTDLSIMLATAGPELRGPTFWMPEQASSVAGDVDWIFSFINVICYIFFVLIVGVMVWFMIRYRRRPGVPAEVTVTHNTPLELTWTIIPLILVIGIFYVGMRGYINLRLSPQGAYEVDVIGQKWLWTFKHRNGAIAPAVLQVPVNRPVKLNMTSQDVLHSLFIPAFRVKQDVVPGRVTTLWFESLVEGEFELYCSEYCGQQHSQMLAKVLVYNEEDFAVAIAEAKNWIKDIPDDQLWTAGPRLYARCQQCHSLDGSVGTGPSWKGLWERTQNETTVFTDGTTLADYIGEGKDFSSPEDYILQSIVNPQQKIVENFTGSMPTFQGQLNAREKLAILEFIKNLDRFDEQGNLIAGDGDAGETP